MPDRLEELPGEADLPNRFPVYSDLEMVLRRSSELFGAAGAGKAEPVPMEVSELLRESANRGRDRGSGTFFPEDICIVEGGEESRLNKAML